MWNYYKTKILFKYLKSKRDQALNKDKYESALGYEIIHYLSKYPSKVFSRQELVDEFGLKSPKSLGGHLKAQTIVMKDLGMDINLRHSWFVDWIESVPTWKYWLDPVKAELWLKCVEEFQKNKIK